MPILIGRGLNLRGSARYCRRRSEVNLHCAVVRAGAGSREGAEGPREPEGWRNGSEQGGRGAEPDKFPVAMARGIHLFPSRTQKLSLFAPMVLGWKRPGRVGRCRIPLRAHHSMCSVFCAQNPHDRREKKKGDAMKRASHAV